MTELCLRTESLLHIYISNGLDEHVAQARIRLIGNVLQPGLRILQNSGGLQNFQLVDSKGK